MLTIALDVVELDVSSGNSNKYELVSGLTNMGIPKLAYEIADKKGWTTVGFSAEEAKEYECYDVDKEIIVGKKFGDESEEFIT